MILLALYHNKRLRITSILLFKDKPAESLSAPVVENCAHLAPIESIQVNNFIRQCHVLFCLLETNQTKGEGYGQYSAPH